MEYQEISSECIGPVTVLTINRPAQTNKLSIPTLEELVAALERANSDPDCRAVVLTGSGEYFCNGGQLGDYRHQSSLEIRRFGEAFIRLHQMIISLSKPVIAAVQGDAHGGGVNLVEACDLAVAAKEATFAVPEIRFGLAPMMALTGISRVLTRKGAAELSLFGEPISAQRATEIGLINWIAERDEVLPLAIKAGNRLAEFSPTAMALYKKLYCEIGSGAYAHQMESGLSMLVSLLKSEDAGEALTAQHEKRPPGWKNR